MKTKLILGVGLLTSALYLSAFAQGTAFTYQGRLNDGANPASGSYDLRLILYDNSIGGSQQGLVLTNSATAVSNGLFTVTLDFGPVFPGAARWLEIAVRTNGPGNFLPLVPRQALTPAPYAITAGNVTPGAGLSGTYGSAVTFNNAANSISGNGAGLVNVNATSLNGLSSSSLWQLGGNNVSGGQFLGSLNNQALEFRANGLRVLRVEPLLNDGTHSNMVNLAGGSSANFVAPGVYGATLIGGGAANYLANVLTNSVTADFGTVVGGGGNTASGLGAVALGILATASGAQATALGGNSVASGNSSFAVSGGQASGNSSFAGAGSIASGINSVALGSGHATGTNSFAVGVGSEAAGLASVALGAISTAYGDYSVALGFDSYTYQPYGLAAGRLAISDHRGAFVWADSQGTIFSSTANDQFLVRAAGGVGIGTNSPAGQLHVASASGNPQVQITQNIANNFARLRMNVAGSPSWEMDVGPGATPSISWWTGSLRMNLDYNGNLTTTGTVNGSSDRNVKDHFSPVSARYVLEKVSALPITEWNYKTDGDTLRHIGPMAQDFYAAFNVGADDKHISMVDADGVALAAIQGLNQKVEEQRAENAELKRELSEIKQLLTKISARRINP